MEKEKRKLSKGEEKRKKLYEEKKKELIEQGYEEKDLTISVVYANIMALVLGLPIIIFLFIIFSFPMLIFSIIGINGDNLINVIIYMSKFIIKPKLLLYSK